MTEQIRYRIGIDVGLYSVGFAAVEVDDQGYPRRLLKAQVHQHDAGVDPLQGKTAKTRLAESGVARRVRRLIQRRRKRLAALDRMIVSQGWPLVSLENEPDAWLPWKVRARLVSEKIADQDELGRSLSIALRHMARHRGWRNPWTSVASLSATNEPSEFLINFRERVASVTGKDLPIDVTPAELVMIAKTGPSLKLRGEGGLIGGKLHQSDNANELRAVARRQGLSDDLFQTLLEAVFEAKSPRGASAKLVGKDVLPGRESEPRAAKSTLAFQRYRIAALIGNMRIEESSKAKRVLTVAERREVMDYLDTTDEQPSWADVAELLGISRRALKGVAQSDLEADLVATRPAVNVTDQTLRKIKIKSIKQWWENANDDEREALVRALSNSGVISEDSAPDLAATELIESLPEEDLAKLDGLHLPAGRAAYSERSLREITEQIMQSEDDLHAARKRLFGVDDKWRPPVEPIGERVGNPAVDRVLRIVARWLEAAEREWGAPESINVEHVREALGSVAAARDLVRQNEKRYEQRRREMAEIREKHSIDGEVRQSDVRRYQAVIRQNSQCLYCGTGIKLHTAEMDHIVPRAGTGSTNTRTNLVAVCRDCNADKSNTLFSVWAAKTKRPEVSLEGALQRVNAFLSESGVSARENKKFQSEVKRRLKATELDDPVDARSIESVAWMANQLHLRIAGHFHHAGTEVRVFRGQITAWARKASGIEGRIEFIGGRGKTRLDRRHHAVDAAVTAMMRHSVAQTLAERDSLRIEQWSTTDTGTWKQYRGGDPAAQVLFDRWRSQMEALVDLLNEALREDRIPITENLRLRLGSSAAHDDTIRKLDMRQVGDELSVAVIDRASTPALWCALTRHPDFSPTDGLPADPERRIRLQCEWLDSGEKIGFFSSDAAAASILVRGGSADIGNTIHHARVYRVSNGKRSFYAMLRVFQVDLVRHQSSDLFSVELPPQSISVRTSEPRLRTALAEDRAEYLGWLVEGDELLLDMSSQTKGQIGELLADYPGTVRWRVSGFPHISKLRLRPRLLAAEGLPDPIASTNDSDAEQTSSGTRMILAGQGWRPGVNVIFDSCDAVVIRRDTLGRVRLSSHAHLPASWSVRTD
ncbi:CRISPR-associated endonuclease Csn1 [Micrococcales bacterium KH10]|nr:CRISPR-associated endonuclease Csn1 [Micrococcales bacterium KH10]